MVDSLAVSTLRVGYTITIDALDAPYKKIKSKIVTMIVLLANMVQNRGIGHRSGRS